MSDRVICHLQTAAVLLPQCQDASAIANDGNDTAQIELKMIASVGSDRSVRALYLQTSLMTSSRSSTYLGK